MTDAVKSFAKKTFIATLTVATIATSGMFAGVDTAQAGSRDFWKGAAVGAVGTVIVGSAIHNSRKRKAASHQQADGHAWSDEQHTRWCFRKYRSYDSRSDTYQPRRGARRYCNSPYN